jgi:1,2-dihydroxy-3-keto-5-methylthiopentene dioxygenase
MAYLDIPEQKKRLTDAAEINRFLKPFGIQYERWDIGAPRVGPDAPSEEILAAYDPEIKKLMAAGGYVTADVINIVPDTPNLQVLLDKFNKEHTHSEDEVRFIVKGRGVFHIHPDGGPVFGITLEAGDLINVPKGTKHWFDLCSERTIRAIRLFQDKSGWTPYYVDNGVHSGFTPMCWSVSDIPFSGKAPPAWATV